ncbi:MAG: TonB-dependent receptor [Granulosicoccus sp.]
MVICKEFSPFVVCIFLILAPAQDLFANNEFDFDVEDVPIVLSASRLRQPISESPASITVIDRQMIEQSGARSIVDILLLVPGFQVGRRLNGNPVATYHGLSERYNPRLQLLVDGRPTYVPLFGGIPWGELPIALSDIERIEVTRAPNAATFGPNSFTAVVSITTRNPASDSGWRSISEAGGNKFSSSTLTYFGSSGLLDYRFTLQAENDEGYKNLPDRERGRLASFRSFWQVNSTDRIGFDIGILRAGHIILSPLQKPELLAPYEETTNGYTQLRWERSLSVDDTWRLQYYYNYYDIQDSGEYIFDLGEVADNVLLSGILFSVDLNRNSRSLRHELELQRSKRLSDRTRVVFGGAIRQDAVEGRYVFNDSDSHTVTTQRVFSHVEIEAANAVLINAGLLLEQHSLSGLSASPRGSIIYKISRDKQFRLGYSHGVRTPLLLEEEGELVLEYNFPDGEIRTDNIANGLPGIHPETSDVIDLGFYQIAMNRGLTFDAKLSWQTLNDVIATERIPSEQDTFDGETRHYFNRFDYSYNTAEFQIDFSKNPIRRLRASYSYAFGMDFDLNRRRLVPRHTVSLFGSENLTESITLSAEYYYASEWVWDDVRDVSKLSRLDLRLAKNILLGRTDIELALQAEWALGDNVNYLERNEVADAYFAKLLVQFP